MDEDLSSFKTIAGKLRYSNDIYRKGENGNDAGLDRVRNGFLQEGLLISTAVTPELARNLKSVCQRLGILEINVDAFVYASKDIQAECFGSGSTKTLIRFSSALIELLDADEFEFVVGHELGHFLLKHGLVHTEVDNSSAEHAIQKRAQEISADRIGLVACQSLEVAIKALMKTASGLSNTHLRFDVSSFVSQLRDSPETISLESQISTHPSILIRCRALLWFSMSDMFTRGVEYYSKEKVLKLDKRIINDMNKFVDAPFNRRIKEAETNLELWTAAYSSIQGGTFNKEDQKRISELFGESILGKLKTFLSNTQAEETEQIVFERLKEARDSLEQLIPSRFEVSVKNIQQRIDSKLT